MHNLEINFNNIENIIVDEKLYKTLILDNESGLVLIENKNKKIIFMNKIALSLLNLRNFIPENFEKILNDEELIQLFSGERVQVEIEGESVTLVYKHTKDYSWVYIIDNNEISIIEDFSNKAESLKHELISAFTNFGDDTIMIVNGQGIIEFAGKEISKTCGLSSEEFVGENVFDMEKKGIFSPSVSVKILDTKLPQAVIQKTAMGMELLSVGAPILDDDGNIEKVVSLTRDYSYQIKLSKFIGELKDSSNFVGNSEDKKDDNIVTCTNKMFEMKMLAQMIAPTDATVIIYGETGTGKEVFAQYIYKNSKRRDNPFIKVNCGTISHSIVESELFGYEGGSFTGANKEGKIGLIEAANGGTLFLDEVGELPMEQQVKLLHVLQEHVLTRVGGVKSIKLDIRIIAATNKNLKEAVEKGLFREDLYYRLNVIPMYIPSLRERKDDVPLLAKHFLKRFCEVYDKQVTISSKVLDLLSEYDWPGNIRQLENTVERLVLTAVRPSIITLDLPDEFKRHFGDKDVHVNKLMRIDEAIGIVEKELIEMALKEYHTTVRAAEVLGVNQSTVSRKISHYGIKKDLDNK